MSTRTATEADWPAIWPFWQEIGFEVVGTVPRSFDSVSHGRVGLHVMYLDLG